MVSVHAKLHVQACFQLEVGQTLPGESTVNKIKRAAASSRVRPPEKTVPAVRFLDPFPKKVHDSVRPLLQSKHQRKFFI